jgi:hypothetical protein
MEKKKTIGFDMIAIGRVFGIRQQSDCQHLTTWLNAEYTLTDFEQKIIDDTHQEIAYSSEQMNEEELKVRLIAPLFYVSKVDETNKIRVFYERGLSADYQEYHLSVVSDCLVASTNFNLPEVPYFFLQEFKKAKGEKKDPEAQMLMAMLIAQIQNNDEKPIYGSYLIGTGWRFATLVGKNYCLSSKYEATQKSQLEQIVFILRKLKELIVNR